MRLRQSLVTVLIHYSLTINGVSIISSVDLSTDTITDVEVQAALTAAATNLANAGVVVSGNTTDGITLTAADSRNIEVDEAFRVTLTATLSGSVRFAALLGVAGSTVNKCSMLNITLTSGRADHLGRWRLKRDAGFSLTIQTSSATGTAIGSGSIATLAGAQTMITSIDNALTTVNGGRADLGALQARFESVANSLSVAAETAAAARSRVQDADFAAESANLARNQVLQQAGISMLAQANAMPQQVLALFSSNGQALI